MMEELHPAGASPDSITVLRPVDSRRMLAKSFTIASNGRVVKREWDDVGTFRVEQAQAESIEALHAVLVALERDPHACIIRGAPKAATDLARTRRTLKKGGGAFADVPRSWIMLDADKVPLPPGASVVADPVDVARCLVDLFAGFAPELEGATCVVQFSSSAGLDEIAAAETTAGLADRWSGVAKAGLIGAHLWFRLAEPQSGPALVRWGKAINARLGHKAIDTAVFTANQALYNAAPVFGDGLRDPLRGRRTVLVRGSADAVTLEIPEEAARHRSMSGEARDPASAGLGFVARLDRIGHPVHGFNEPIMSAIASFVATRWPLSDDDVEGLVQALQDRITTADPGGRSQSEMDRYASREYLTSKVEWACQMQAEKAETLRAQRAAAAVVEPTFPDRSVTAQDGARIAREAIEDFARDLEAGARPDMLLRVTVGGGKSEAAVRSVGRLLEAAKTGGRSGALFYLVPRHDLGGEIAERIARAHPGRTVATWRGMEAKDPITGRPMCEDPELARAARDAGLSASDACQACPLRSECGYQRQRGQQADVWLAAHNLAFQDKPAGLPTAAAMVIDEAFWQAAVKEQNGTQPIQVALSALNDTRTGTLDRASAEYLIHLRRKALAALEGHEAGGILADAFQRVGMTALQAGDWHDLEWQTKPKADLHAGMSRAAILDRLADLAGNGFSPRRAIVARHVRDLLSSTAARSVNVTFVPDADLGRGQGSGPALRLAWREDFAKWAADAPKLYLDATTHPDVVRVWAPDLRVVDIEIAAPRQHVRQVIDREFGRTFFAQNPNNVRRLADLVVVELAEAGGGTVLVVAQEAVETLLRAELERRLGGELPAGIHLAHHGAVTGMDRWRDVARVVVVGRPALNRTSGERLAEIVKGEPIGAVEDGDRDHWPKAQGGVRRPDGTGARLEHPRHPDPLVEALRWSITEGAVLQAIGRARGVQRTAPVHVTLLARLPLPLTVADMADWEEVLPDRLTVAAAEAAIMGRACPFAPADMVVARPDLWATVKAAERDKERIKTPHRLIDIPNKGLGGFARQSPARYSKNPRGGRWSWALVPAEGGRAALEALVGELAAFELVLEQAQPGRPAEVPADVSDARKGPRLAAEELDALPPQRGLAPSAWLSLVAPSPQSGFPAGIVIRRPPPPAETPPDLAPAVPGVLVLADLPPLPGDSPRPPVLPGFRPGIVPPVPPPSARERLTELARWWDGFPRPPRLHGDGLDIVREMHWRERVARYPKMPASPSPLAETA